MSSASDALKGFPIVAIVNVAWGDLDAFGHVNNTMFFRYFEDARIAYLDALDFLGGPPNSIGVILHSTMCRFRRPIKYPDTLRVGARVTEIAEDRFTMEYRIFSNALDEVAGEGGGVLVAYDYFKGHKIPLPEVVRTRIDLLEKGVDEAKTERARPRTRRR